MFGSPVVLSITSVRSTDGVLLLTLDFEHEVIMVAANRSTDKVCFINLLMDVRHRCSLNGRFLNTISARTGLSSCLRGTAKNPTTTN